MQQKTNTRKVQLMVKCFKKNGILKRQASMVLVLAMLATMLTGLWIEPKVQAAEKIWDKFSSLASLTEVNEVLTNTIGNVTLRTGYYIVDKNTTITASNATSSADANSAIVISGAVELYIPKGVTLTVKGGDAYYAKPGAAGIELSAGNTLSIFGEGTLVATGGNAGNGSDGGTGGNGGNSSRGNSLSTGTAVNFNNSLCWGDSIYAGAGGAGGNGGGGAGAGIGTKGGAGGTGASNTGSLNHKFMTYTSGTATDLAWNDLRSKTAKNGTSGGTGSHGGTFGEIYTDSHVTITATGGAAGTLGGAAGAYGKSLFMKAEISSYIYYVGCYAGGGGAGGGAGFAAYGIGTGGTGGNGGNSGGQGNLDVGIKDVVSWGSGCYNSTITSHARTYGAYGEGGAGGKGSVNGAAGSQITYTHSNCTCSGGAWKKVGGSAGTALAAANRSAEMFALSYTPNNIGFVDTSDNNFHVGSLNNLVDSDGHLVKHVNGDDTSNLRVELASDNQGLVAYKLADVTWDGDIASYTYPIWIDKVAEWINSESRTDDFKRNLSTYRSSASLAMASSDLQDYFFRTLAADTTLLETLEPLDAPKYSSEDVPNRESEEDAKITRYYALFENLSFGTYIIVAPGHSPVVINIIPERSATGFVVPILFEATLKGGGVDITKKINGHDVDTVSVGDSVDFEISFKKPTPSDITEDSVVLLTDTMSNAFLLDPNTSIKISTDQAGTQLLENETDYFIGTPSTNEDGSMNIPITFAASSLRAISAERIYVKYSAIVTEDVKYNSEGNYNTAVIQVDHLSSIDTVYAYTYGLNIIKLDGTSAENMEDMDHLGGAEFHLFKEKYIYFGNVFKGTFDEKAGIDYTLSGVEVPADGFIDACKANSNQYYVYAYTAPEAGSITVDGEAVVYAEDTSIVRIFELVTKGINFSDQKGTITSEAKEEGITIGGLNSGRYILLETRAPVGYQSLAEDIYFEINRLTEDEAKAKTAGSLSPFYEMGETIRLNETGKITIYVLNYKGLTLPSTGGMGTLLFTILGIAIMLSVIIILIVKRRTNSANYYV